MNFLPISALASKSVQKKDKSTLLNQISETKYFFSFDDFLVARAEICKKNSEYYLKTRKNSSEIS